MIARILPRRAKHFIRRSARLAAKVRQTRAWPVLRPAYRAARRVVNVDRLLGGAGVLTATDPAAKRIRDQVNRAVRNLRTRGFTERAVRVLEAFAADGSDPVRQQLASWELALWHADQHDADSAREALRWLAAAARDEFDPLRLRRIAVVTAECHDRLGETELATQVLEEALAQWRTANLLLARANLATTPTERLAWMNRALGTCGLSPVMLDDAGARTGLDALVNPPGGTTARPGRQEDLPTVSILVPAHNCEATIGTALRSILSQTWQNVEVIVVDDASTDGTAEAVREFERTDARVRLVPAGTNGGAYVSRNLALNEATGEFVTCHDADDWSHPEKIEQQVRHLRQHPEVVANTSQQTRATADLRFLRRGKPGFYVSRNLSSFMFRREPVLASVGYWDSVRFGADEEFARRVKLSFGDSAVVDLETGPLCIQRQAPGSLTADDSFGYPGFFMGARLDYKESYEHHHRTATSLRYEFPQRARPFAVAAPLLWRPEQKRAGQRRHFDVIIASDFRMVGGSTQSNVEEIKAQRQAGLRTGLIQMSRYDIRPERPVLPPVRELLDGGHVQMLVYGERVSCDLLIVRYPPVLQDWQRYLPDVVADQVRVVVNQPPMSDYGPGAVVRYELERAAEHLRRFFGTDAVWHPIGPQVRRALHEHHSDTLPAVELSDRDWVNIIDVAAWRRPSRPPAGARIRIGRHSRDHPVKWPTSASELLAIYPDAPGYEVRILGGGCTPEQVLGYWPAHWRAWPFGAMHPREFLADLDVFVYYTNPDWVESFGRVVLEAMAVGVPVIVPHTYEDLFGDAAIYAKPPEVVTAIDSLMKDADYYETQVRTAQQYVEQKFGYSMHAERVRSLLGSGASAHGTTA